MIERTAAVDAIDRFYEAYLRCSSLDPELFPPLGPCNLLHSHYLPLEAEVGFPLPWSFKEWHRRHSSEMLPEVAGISLPLSPRRRPLAHLKRELLDMNDGAEAVQSRVLPFSYCDATGQILAFDARRAIEGADWPIIELEHEVSILEALSAAEAGAASFVELLSFLAAALYKEPERRAAVEARFIGDVE